MFIGHSTVIWGNLRRWGYLGQFADTIIFRDVGNPVDIGDVVLFARGVERGVINR